MSETQVQLTGDQLSPFFSRFLMGGGSAEDVPLVASFKAQGKHCEAVCALNSYFVSPYDQRFHLSAITGTSLLIQVGMVHGLVLAGHSEKTVEVYMSEYSVTLRRQVLRPENILLALDLVNRTVVPAGWRRTVPRSFHRWRFSLSQDNDEAWFGTMTLVFPFS